MITRADLNQRVREWGLREDVVEKDYVLGWVLWGIGSDRLLSTKWVFKGGTCLKKCYIETYRFSEDLDFSILPQGPLLPDDLAPIIERILRLVTAESGIDFSDRPPNFRIRASGQSVEGRIYYRGPRNTPGAASIKLDLTGNELVVRPTVLREVAHPYPDGLPTPATVRCYSFEELFAEKLRAMGERGRPRDLYDIVNLFHRRDLRQYAELVRTALIDKCRAKGVPIPTYQNLEVSPYRSELESEWENMLGHQLQATSPFSQFWGELVPLFEWLDGNLVPEMLEPMPLDRDEEPGWSPPPTIWSWGEGVPLETVRFAAANHLCVELGYKGSVRTIEPYSLRRTRQGNLVLHAIKSADRGHRSYRVDRMHSLRATNIPFTPAYAIEFSSAGPLYAPLTRASATTRPSAMSRVRRAVVYMIECPVCGKRFRRVAPGLGLRPHKDKNGWLCSGRHGSLVDTEYA